MTWFFRKNRRNIEKADFRESREDCPNPGRGWYRLFSMDAAEGAPLLDWKYAQGEGETLALLQVDIGAFAGGVIPTEALSNIRQACLLFREEKKELLLRFVYDREGKGLEREPAFLRRILGHMEQLAPLLAEFSDIIFCLQGLFVGSWGEMHDSRFLTGQSLGELWKHFYRIAPENCFFAVRRPEQWMTITGRSGDAPEEDIRRLRLGLFNDGLLGSATDLGTFPEAEREESLRFQNMLCRYVPNGGEAVGEDICGEVERAVEHFQDIRISYLNSVYDGACLNRWKNSTYQGENGYAYIGRRLGYRFVVTNADLVGKTGNQKIQIELENRGFAPVYEACEIRLRVGEDDAEREAGSGETAQLHPDCESGIPGQGTLPGGAAADLRQLLPGSRMNVQFDISGQGCGSLFLYIYRKKDHRIIRLANEGAGEEFRIGRLGDGI